MWEHLLHVGNGITHPWILSGDFNTISTPAEKQGGNPPNLIGIQEFNHFILDAGLSDVGFHGSKYTWSCNCSGLHRIWERLDQVLLNEDCLAAPTDININHLARVELGHSPFHITFGNPVPRQSRFISGCGLTTWVSMKLLNGFGQLM